MNKNILISFIIFCSLFSWLFGAYIFLEFFYTSKESVNIIKDNSTQTIKTWKTITITDLENQITKLSKEISPSVVNIVISKDMKYYRKDPSWFFDGIETKKKKVWWGTWFFITNDGVIITNKHVINDNNASYTVITNSWEEYESKVLAIDPLTDLAIIKVISNNWAIFDSTPLKLLQDQNSLKIWQFAIAIWNALAEFQNSVTFWVISWKNRSLTAGVNKDQLSGLIQTDAAINPWNSWGPLVNLNWEVVGINTAIANWNSVWFAIPLTKARIDYILKSIEKYGVIKRPFIWIKYTILTPYSAKQLWLDKNYWAYLSIKEQSVVPNSSADKSWLKPWDIILSVDWVKVNQVNNINSMIQNKLPWETLKLEVYTSSKQTKTIKLTLWDL